MISESRISIAGGGIGGLAAAVALASSRFDVAVFEQASRFGGAGSGLILQQNGMAALDAISPDLGERIRASGHCTRADETRLIMDSAGRVLAEEPLLREQTGTGRHVSILRSRLHECLVDEARARKVDLHMGRAVTGHSQQPVGVQLSDGTTQPTDLIVAADGLRSRFRAVVVADGRPRYCGYTSVRGQTTRSGLNPRSLVVNGRGIQLFVAPVGGETLYWTAKITAPEGHWPALGPEGAVAALFDRIAHWHNSFLELVADHRPGDIVVTDIYDRHPTDRWVDGRVCLLGDAAHPMTPALGQGANVTLEDAAVLGDALRRYAGIDEALHRYEQARVPRARAVVLAARRQGKLDQGAGRLAALKRDLAMRFRGRKDAAIDVAAWSAPVAPVGQSQPTGRSATAQTARTGVGPIWRDANVRSGPTLDSPILQVLWPHHGEHYSCEGYVHGDEVIEGAIVSDIWLQLAPGRWCSAVNFDQDTVLAATKEYQSRQQGLSQHRASGT
ncbi:MAG: FAD-dependent monooxygenase [Dermatophilaceae bacterium]